MSNYRHLFFDLDRTLWDMEKNASETLAELFHKHKLSDRGIPTAELFIKHYNTYNDLLWDRYRKKTIDKATLRALRFKQTFAHLGVHDHKLADVFDLEYIIEAPKKTNLIPGTIELLETLKKQFQLHIITNGFPEVQHHKMAHSGLEKYFDIIITSEGCGYAKPDLRIFKHALKKSGSKKEEALMIGDDLHADIIGAREAGWDQVFFNPNKGDHSEDVTYEISELKEIFEIVA
ncbi:YjjG family noncanonical pyrimidine nucleotidase [soil metagenome]